VCFSQGFAWNTDFFFGYFDKDNPGTSTGPRIGFKILNPNPGWRCRLFAFSQSGNHPQQIPDLQASQFEFHWIPSGLGDGSGKAIGTVAGVPFTNEWTAASAITCNAFGWLIPSQPDYTAQSASAWFDNVEYKVSGLTGLTWQRMGDQLVLSWGADGYSLQYNDSSITNASGWAISPEPVVLVGRTYYSTNTIGPGTRFFRLKLKCP
jgi:hypothetical protein